MEKTRALFAAFEGRIKNEVGSKIRDGSVYSSARIPENHILLEDGFTESGLRCVTTVDADEFLKMFGDAVNADGTVDFEKMSNIDKANGYGYGRYIQTMKREAESTQAQ